MTLPPRLPKSLLEHTPWDKDSNPIWPASSFFLLRNLAKYNFAHKLSEAHSLKMLDLVTPPLLKLSTLKNPVCLKAEALSALEKEFLYEHFLYRESFQNTLKGQAFVVDDSGHFLALLNLQDHLQLELVDCKGQWEKAWEALNKIDTTIGQALDYAFSPRFGYLTSDPTCCGTALLVMCYLHVPLLIHSGQLEETLKSHQEASVSASGLQSTLDEHVGDFLVLQNTYTLGLTEENILRDLHMMATKIILSEKTLRQRCKESQDPHIKDQISRSYGLLMHSYQLQTKEALDALSKMKLGIDLGWIKGVPDSKINEVFFKCRRAHIGFLYGESALDQEVILQKRAEFLRKELQTAEIQA